MTDLDIIAQLEAKIQRLPPQIAVEVNDYVDFLLQKYQEQLLPVVPDEIRSHILQRQQDVLQQVDFVWDEADEKHIEQVSSRINQWYIQTF